MLFLFFFFFNDTATTEIYTLSLHDALPISQNGHRPLRRHRASWRCLQAVSTRRQAWRDRKSTRLNSSHLVTSYAVFCLKNKKINDTGARCTYPNIIARDAAPVQEHSHCCVD